jgi:hypothetical protein
MGCGERGGGGVFKGGLGLGEGLGFRARWFDPTAVARGVADVDSRWGMTSDPHLSAAHSGTAAYRFGRAA